MIYLLYPTNNSSVFEYVLGRKSALKIEGGKVNVLLLGIPGGKHDGPNLTDTIMVASYDINSNKARLISLPRDVWVDQYKVKVNTLYHLGLKEGDGLGLVKQEIGEILGLKIPYAIRIDFSGFVKAVDLIGGIDVEIAKTFDDYVYPVPGKEDELCGFKEQEMDIDEGKAREMGVLPGKLKVLYDPQGNIATASAAPNLGIVYTDKQVIDLFPCRFEHLSFKQGLAKMDGETALKFVRSRHGTNGEGTDFARSRRQQLVLQAFKDKVLSIGTFLDPRKVIELAKAFDKSIETDISQGEYLDFVKLVKDLKEVKSFVIDGSGDDPLLVSPPAIKYGGAWVLVPAGGDYSRVHQFVQTTLADSSATESAKQNK